jgi:hypothetical protein
MSQLLAVVVGGAFTLSGVLGGAAFTTWLGSRNAKAELARAERAEQRRQVIEVLRVGREWVRNLTPLIATLSVGLGPNDAATQEVTKEHGPAKFKYEEALSAADLMLADDRVHAALRDVANHFEGQSAVTTPLALKTMKATKPTHEERSAAFQYAKDHSALLDAFAAIARDRLVKAITDDR